MLINRQQLTFIEKTGYLWFLLIFFIVGTGFLGFGAYEGNSLLGSFFTIAGSSIIGAVCGTFLSVLSGARLHKDVISIRNEFLELSRSFSTMLNFQLSVDEEKIRNYRMVVHKYNRTRISDGQELWMHHEIDFSKTVVPGRLYAKKTVYAHGIPHDYEYNGFLVDKRFILIIKPLRGCTKTNLLIIRVNFCAAKIIVHKLVNLYT